MKFEEFRGIYEHVGIGITKVSTEGRFLMVNPRFSEILGYTSEELLTLNFAAITHPDDVAKSIIWREELESGRLKSVRGEKRYLRKDGRTIWVYVAIQAIQDENGKVTHFVSSTEDITEQKRSQELLAHQKHVLEHLAQGHALNETLAEVVKLIEAQAPGCKSTIYLVEDGKLRLGAAPSFPEEFVKAVDGCPIGPTQGSCGAAAHYGKRIVSSNIPTDPWWTEHREWILSFGIRAAWSTPVLSKDGLVIGTVSMCWSEPKEPSFRDLELVDVATSLMALAIERKRFESRLSASKELERALSVLKATLESTADGILVTDGVGNIAAFNRHFLEMWKLPDSIYKSMSDVEAMGVAQNQLKDPASFTSAIHKLNKSNRDSFDVLEFKDGRVFERYSKAAWIGESQIGRVWSFRDVSDRRRMEGKIQTADRMASLGRLSAGVAHEINNPLSHVIMSLELASEKLSRSSASAEKVEAATRLIDLAQKSAQRISDIVKDLNTFSHPHSDQLGATDVSRAIADATQIVANQIRHRARLVQKLRSAPLISANEGRLNQVLVNLLVNAVQAIPEGNVEDHEICVSNWTDEQGLVVIEIRDTGIGMSEETKKHLFDPFFTTKPAGTGTGLGLSIVYNIIQSFGGQIEVDSIQGRGTSVRIRLRPARVTAPVLTALDVRAPEQQPGRRRGRILVIDDEDLVADMMKEAFSPEHDVMTATDGRRACEMLVSDPTSVDLVFCDLMMPGMTGVDIYEQVKKAAPELEKRFIFMTGGAFTDKTLEFSRQIGNRIVQKPFRLNAIREMASNALEDKNKV